MINSSSILQAMAIQMPYVYIANNISENKTVASISLVYTYPGETQLYTTTAETSQEIDMEKPMHSAV